MQQRARCSPMRMSLTSMSADRYLWPVTSVSTQTSDHHDRQSEDQASSVDNDAADAYVPIADGGNNQMISWPMRGSTVWMLPFGTLWEFMISLHYYVRLTSRPSSLIDLQGDRCGKWPRIMSLHGKSPFPSWCVHLNLRASPRFCLENATLP